MAFDAGVAGRGLRLDGISSRVDGIRSRLDGIDLLRGLAIFFVLMNHVNMRLLFAHVPYTQGLAPQLVDSLVWNGQLGVQIFFAVSGFLITATSLRRWGGLGQVRVGDFYRMRFARIAPLLGLLLVVLSGLHLAGLRFQSLTNFVVGAETGGLGRALVAAVTFHVNWLEASRGYLPGNWDILWSLSVEEMFYLFFPLLCRGLGRGRGRGLVGLLLVFAVLGPFWRSPVWNPNPVWREYSYLGGMDAIALGCLAAMVSGRLRIGGRLGRAWLWVLAGVGAGMVAGILCFTIPVARWGWTRLGLDMTVLAAGVCLILIAAQQSGWRAGAGRAGGLGWVLGPVLLVGRRSYEVYLTHEFVVLGLAAWFVRMGKPVGLAWGLFGVVIVVAAGLGEVVGRFYSEPANRWLRKREGVARLAEKHL